jgi:hypothetical protein
MPNSPGSRKNYLALNSFIDFSGQCVNRFFVRSAPKRGCAAGGRNLACSAGINTYLVMTRYKISRKDNLLLFSESLDDRLPEDDEVYAFDALIDQIDVSSITCKYSTLGSKCFHPRTMIKVLFYGYRRGIFSSRKLHRKATSTSPTPKRAS